MNESEARPCGTAGAGWLTGQGGDGQSSKKKASSAIELAFLIRIGRGERIRTFDPCLPKTVLYQAELHPDGLVARRLAVASPLKAAVRRFALLVSCGSKAAGNRLCPSLHPLASPFRACRSSCAAVLRFAVRESDPGTAVLNSAAQRRTRPWR